MSDRAIKDQRLLALIRPSHAASGGVYRSPRVFLGPREVGEGCGKNRVARLMKVARIREVRGYRSPRPVAGRPSLVAPNRLNREFTVEKPKCPPVTDITYIRT